MHICRSYLLLLVITISTFITSCDESDPKPPKSAAKSITEFKFSGITPVATGNISESTKKITVNVPASTQVDKLKPTILISEKATISPSSGVAQDFTNPVVYTVTAEDGSEQTYEVTVVLPKISNKSISSFKFAGLNPVVEGVITETEKKIALTVPKGTDVTSLVPTIVFSDKATINPASGAANNFSNPVIYVVTAEDGTTEEYEVTVTALKSTEKNILSFKFINLTPQVVGTIDQSTKRITVIVPNVTNVTVLTPAITLSEKATVSPASGIINNFSTPVKYTVTAEDGSTQEYTITVIVDPTVSFTVTDVASYTLEQDGVLAIFGSNLGSTENNKVVFINKNDRSITHTINATNGSSQNIEVKIPADFPLGEYEVKVFVGAESMILDRAFKVEVHAPLITTVDKSSVNPGDNITITGKYFMATGNQITLENATNTINLTVVSQSPTSITVTVPLNTPVATDYILNVKPNEKRSWHNHYILVLAKQGPTITDVNRLTFSRGETIVIYGFNLKKPMVASNINFVPVGGGITQLRSGIGSSDGTQVSYSIPADFPTGTYNFFVEVDFEFSNEYGYSITINP